MRLFEFVQKPKNAGEAVLVFGHPDNKKSLPILEGNVIFLPDNPESEIFFLSSGTQFLLNIQKVKKTTGQWGTTTAKTIKEIWLGGSIESTIFLAKVEGKAFEIFKTQGEKAFLAALQPTEIMNGLKGLTSQSWSKRGYLYLIDIGISIERLRLLAHILCGLNDQKITFKIYKDHAIFGRASTLNGLGFYPDSSLFVGNGTLITPGYPTLEMQNIHIIAAADYLSEIVQSALSDETKYPSDQKENSKKGVKSSK